MKERRRKKYVIEIIRVTLVLVKKDRLHREDGELLERLIVNPIYKRVKRKKRKIKKRKKKNEKILIIKIKLSLSFLISLKKDELS